MLFPETIADAEKTPAAALAAAKETMRNTSTERKAGAPQRRVGAADKERLQEKHSQQQYGVVEPDGNFPGAGIRWNARTERLHEFGATRAVRYQVGRRAAGEMVGLEWQRGRNILRIDLHRVALQGVSQI
jgi:hypothetical protein